MINAINKHIMKCHKKTKGEINVALISIPDFSNKRVTTS